MLSETVLVKPPSVHIHERDDSTTLNFTERASFFVSLKMKQNMNFVSQNMTAHFYQHDIHMHVSNSHEISHIPRLKLTHVSLVNLIGTGGHSALGSRELSEHGIF